jgi:cytochrome c556
MTRTIFGLTTGCGVLLLAFLLLAPVLPRSRAADDEPPQMRETLQKIADLLAKKDFDEAKKLGETLKGAGEADVYMSLMKPQKLGGLGVTDKGGKLLAEGIDKKLQDLGKMPLTAKQLEIQAEALERMGTMIAAIAEVAQYKCPVPKKVGDKDPKEWQSWTEDMRKGGLNFAEAAKAKNMDNFKKAVNKLSGSCSSCHPVFKN